MADPLTISAIGSFVSSAAPFVSAGMAVVGGMQQSSAIKAAGKAQLAEAQYRAAQGRQIAGQERASGQRQYIEDKRKGRLAQSRAIALSAAGGGTTGDVSDIIGDLGSESEYSALTSLFEANDRASQLESGADLALFEGRNAYSAAKTNAKTAMFEGLSKAGGTLFSKYAPTGGGGQDIGKSSYNMVRY
jgi:hypothetical protein